MQALITYFTAVWISFLSFFGVPGADNPTKFIVFGDSGTGSEAQKKLAGVMGQHPADLMLHTGDIAYDSGSEEELQRNFFNVYEPLLEKMPFYPSPGNHDYATDSLAPYLRRFAKNNYYSFDTHAVHFVSLDAVGDTGDAMLKWLENDLKNAGGNKWIVVYFHYPPFSSGSTHGGNKMIREIYVPLFQKYEVDLVFSGHEHNYERMEPIDGVVYVVTGGGGAPLYEFGEPLEATAFRASEHHFVLVETTRCGMTGKAITVDDRIIDTFTLRRCLLE